MSKTYILKNVYDPLTGKYNNVPVTEEVYRAYKRTGWNIDDNNTSFFDHEIQFSQLIGGDDGAYENFREFVSDGNATDDAALTSIRAEQFKKILPTLTEKEQEVLKLLYFDGYSAVEAGELLGISEQAVNKRKRSAFEKIRSDDKLF